MNMINFFYYKHPKTGKIYSDQRMVGYETKPYLHKGVECELLIDYEPIREVVGLWCSDVTPQTCLVHEEPLVGRELVAAQLQNAIKSVLYYSF